MDGAWFKVQKLLKNSVVQILATQGEFNIGQPYIPPEIKNARGSGFLITSEGHILTNAHVVANLLSVTFRAEQSGGLDLRATLIAICPAKDVALLQCHEDDLGQLGDFVPLQFDDDQNLEQMQSVMVAGYPLGRRLTFTSGVISGYEAPEGDATEGSQSYIQIDAPMNPGNSGGPLITLDGKVVGVNSAGIPSAMAQNTNFAIPSRVVMSVLRDLFARSLDSDLHKVVVPPTLGLTTQRVTNAHYKYMGIACEYDCLGVMIKDVLKGSEFGNLERGDILRAIKFANPYKSREDFNVDTHRDLKLKPSKGDKDCEILITNTAFVKFLVNGEESKYTMDRRVSLQELLDTIPSETKLTLEIWRKDKGVLDVQGSFVSQQVLAIVNIYPPFDKLDCVIFAGAVWVPLSTNIINALGDTKYISEYVPFEKRYDPKVIITNVFPTAEIRSLEVVNATETLVSLNGKVIKTLKDLKICILQHLKKNSDEPWLLKFKSEKLIVLDKYETIRKDREILDMFKIPVSPFNQQLFDLL